MLQIRSQVACNILMWSGLKLLGHMDMELAPLIASREEEVLLFFPYFMNYCIQRRTIAMKIFNKTFIIYLIIFCSGIFVGTFLGHTVFGGML